MGINGWTRDESYETETEDGTPIGTGPDLYAMGDRDGVEPVYGIETRYTHESGWIVDIAYIVYEGLALNLPETPNAWWIECITHSGFRHDPDDSGDWTDEDYDYGSLALYYWTREKAVRVAREFGMSDESENLYAPERGASEPDTPIPNWCAGCGVLGHSDDDSHAVRVADLTEGMEVDLEDDTYADPDGEPIYEDQFVTVETVERGILWVEVEFSDGALVRFHAEHELTVRRGE